MNISRLQTDKLIVGTNDVSYVAPDTSPTGTAVLNGPVYVGKPAAAPGYEAALNVASNGAAQSPLDTQPAYQSNLAIKADGNLTVAGDGRLTNVTSNSLLNKLAIFCSYAEPLALLLLYAIYYEALFLFRSKVTQ